MSFLDRFTIQPQHKSDDPEIRLASVPELGPAEGDDAVLVALATEDTDALSFYDADSSRIYTILMVILMVVLALLMVSTIRYSSFKTAGTGRQSIYLILIIAALGMLVYLYSQYMLFGIALAYVSHGIIWYLFSLFGSKRRRKVQTEQQI